MRDDDIHTQRGDDFRHFHSRLFFSRYAFDADFSDYAYDFIIAYYG